MSRHDRKERERQELRQKIFNAASQIILEQGYEQLSMRKIAEKIEYSPTVLYHYFEDKADIVNQIIMENYRACVDKVKSEMEHNSHQSVTVRLRIALKTIIHIFSANSKQFKAVLLSGGDMAMPDPDTNRESSLDLTDRILHEGSEQQVFRPPTSMTSQIINATIFGLVFHIVGHNIKDEDTIDSIAEECAELIIQGLKPQNYGGSSWKTE